MFEQDQQDQSSAPVITLPEDIDTKEIKLCRIDDPNCESCQ